MDGAKLVERFRQQADDKVAPGMYSDDEVLDFASEAEREACIRAKLIFDNTTTAITVIPLLVDTEFYALDQRITHVESVYLDSDPYVAGYRPRLLYARDQTSYTGLRSGGDPHDYGNTWVSRRRFSIDGNRLQYYPKPTSIGAYHNIFRLHVYRLPLTAIDDMGDEPEIPLMHHDGLIDWMLYRAFNTKDSELFDEREALKAEARFEARFGPRPSARAHRMQAEGRAWTTGYGGL